MKLQKAVKQEAIRIAIGVFLLLGVMLGVLAALGRLTLIATVSGVLGCVVAICNFLWLGITVQKVAAASKDQAPQIMRFSYSMRMLSMAVWLVLSMALKRWLFWPCALAPLLFPRITIAGMHLLGLYQPAPKQADDEGGE